MRPARFLFALVCVLISTAAFAQTALTARPSSFNQYAAEETVTLAGTGIAGADHTVVIFEGRAGKFAGNADPLNADTIVMSVPAIVTQDIGVWTIQVQAYDTPTGTPRVQSTTIEIVAVQDTNPPILGLPEIVVAEATSASGAIVQFSTSAINGDGSPVPVTCDHASGANYPKGATVVTCSATNAFGTSTGTFYVVVTDTGNPVLTLPADIVTRDPVVTFVASATDAIDGSLPVVCSPASGSTFALGVTVVRCTARDSSLNETFGTFNVTILPPTPPPTLTLPADMTVEATSAAGAVVTYSATADQNATVVCSPASGSTFALGTTAVNCTATNQYGQTTSGRFRVTVADTTPPRITSLTVSPSNLWPPDHSMIPVTVTATATDAVDPHPLIHIISIQSNQAVDAVDAGDGATSPDWEITGPLTAKLRAERTSGQDRIYTIMVQAVDASGNSTASVVQVKVSQQSSGKSHAAH